MHEVDETHRQSSKHGQKLRCSYRVPFLGCASCYNVDA